MMTIIAQHSAYVNPRIVSILLIDELMTVFVPAPSIARKLPAATLWSVSIYAGPVPKPLASFGDKDW